MNVSVPPASGEPLFTSRVKDSPADFIVDEHLELALDGHGEHLWMRVEKRGLDTADVMTLLQRVYEVGSADIGVSGRKDRQAVTRQWISVRTPLDAKRLDRADVSGLTVVEAQRHRRKLRHGTHRANRFEIVLRGVKATAAERLPAARELLDQAIDRRIRRLAEQGFPNAFGQQRFGRKGRNIERAHAWLVENRVRRPSRNQRSLWLSAARSALFNQVLAARIRAGNWATLMPGEAAQLAGTNSWFRVDGSVPVDAESVRRCRALDIHPTGPLWGRGASPVHADCAQFEASVLDDCTALCAALERVGLEQHRRSLRAVPEALSHHWIDDETLILRFTLGPGCYATQLLAELGVCREANPVVSSELTRDVEKVTH